MFYVKMLWFKKVCIFGSLCFFSKMDVLFFILELLIFHFPLASGFPFALREENLLFVLFFKVCSYEILSVLYFSLSVLYTVYFVVRCCDLCGVLYLFILSQLCTIYNEKKMLKKTITTKLLWVVIPISVKGNSMVGFL